MITQLMFFPQKDWDDQPENYGLSYEIVEIATPAGVRLNGVWLPAESNRGTILFFHGNAGNVSHRFFKAAPLVQKGFNLFLLDYRSYGKSTGKIQSENDLYEDGRVSIEWLIREKKIPQSEIVLYGESIGSAVALETALHYSVKAVILEGALSSMPELAKCHYPFVPQVLLKDFMFNNSEKIKKLQAPLLFIHGTDDTICPLRMAQALFQKAPSQKEFYEVSGAGHNDLPIVAGNEFAKRITKFVQGDSTES